MAGSPVRYVFSTVALSTALILPTSPCTSCSEVEKLSTATVLLPSLESMRGLPVVA
jgi:hypothetical protein